LWSLRLPLTELRLVLSSLSSVEPVLQVCPKRLLLYQVRLALRLPLPLPCLRLQQLLSLKRPIRPLCRLLSFHCSLPLWLQRLRLLLLPQRPLWRLQRLREWFH
jgi:hypothetical protein